MKLPIFLLLPLFLFASPQAWLDLPDDDYTLILETTTPIAQELNHAIALYSRVPKTQLNERIKALKPVIELLTDWRNQEAPSYLKTRLHELEEIARNKYWHLNELEEAYRLGKFEEEYLNRTFFTAPPLKEGRKALFLNNVRRYHTKYGEYWGEYWIEAADPCHRYLLTYRMLWEKQKKENPGIPDFFLWLEEQNLSKDVLYLCHLTDEELIKATATIKDGLLFLENTLLSPDRETEFLFVLDLHENLILAKGSKLIHHNSLSQSKPVLGAGKMVVKNGNVIELSFESGHYTPTPADSVRITRLFIELGLSLPETTRIVFFNEEGKQMMPIQHFLHQHNNQQ